jgi:hypothetical protein
MADNIKIDFVKNNFINSNVCFSIKLEKNVYFGRNI